MLCETVIDAEDLHAHLDGAHGLIATTVGRHGAVVVEQAVVAAVEPPSSAAHRVSSGLSVYACDNCGGEDVRIIDSRKEYGYTRRRKECPECGERFSTYEIRLGEPPPGGHY